MDMDKPELRTLYDGAEDEWSPVRQEAIPWCTTHDHHATASSLIECDRWSVDLDCVISTGGPDHKWWVDVE